jgi:hypothetical protein
MQVSVKKSKKSFPGLNGLMEHRLQISGILVLHESYFFFNGRTVQLLK